MIQAETGIAAKYAVMNDEELYDILRIKAAELGHLPTKKDIPCHEYFKSRFGPWPRILEQAGLKPVSEQHLWRKEKYRKKHQEMRRRSTEYRKQRREEREAGGVIFEKKNQTAASCSISSSADHGCSDSQRA